MMYQKRIKNIICRYVFVLKLKNDVLKYVTCITICNYVLYVADICVKNTFKYFVWINVKLLDYLWMG